jgi:hypothetical protein
MTGHQAANMAEKVTKNSQYLGAFVAWFARKRQMEGQPLPDLDSTSCIERTSRKSVLFPSPESLIVMSEADENFISDAGKRTPSSRLVGRMKVDQHKKED